MANKKLSKLAIVVTGSMLLASCPVDDYDYEVLQKYQRQAIQEKLERMTKEDADFYISKRMDGLHRFHSETVKSVSEKNGRVIAKERETLVDDGLYLDYWAQHDTNGTFIDEYVDYAMLDHRLEQGVKNSVEKKYWQAQKIIKRAEQRRERLQRRSDKLQKQMEELDDLTR